MKTGSGEIGLAQRRQFMGYASCFAAVGSSLLVSGCTPRLNWREVRDPQGLWTASFPAKPVSVSRTLSLPMGNQPQVIRLTLWAAMIDEQRFTLGVAEPQAPTVPETLQGLARSLEEAMLRNIEGTRIQPATMQAATPGSIAEKESGRESRNGGGDRQTLWATGSLRLERASAPLPASLAMRTWIRPPHVIEAQVVGPREGFEQEAAEQFLSSVVIVPPRA